MKNLTVFTPTYNRLHTLPRLYESLKRQTDKNFIWLVIDDGSTDGTGDYIKGLIKRETEFEIQYLYKENGGMHTAHNLAYRNIHTELNVCIDSDDAMPADSVWLIRRAWKQRKKPLVGLIGLDRDMNSGKIIGDSFPEVLCETTLGGYYAAGGKGDKKLIYRTDIMQNIPEYPVFEGEKYVGLAYKYTLADQVGKLGVINEVICDVEYQPDGSTNTMYKAYLQNPIGFAFYRLNAMRYPNSKKRILIDCIHYCSSARLGHLKKFISISPYPLLTVFCIPCGWILTMYIRYKSI